MKAFLILISFLLAFSFTIPSTSLANPFSQFGAGATRGVIKLAHKFARSGARVTTSATGGTALALRAIPGAMGTSQRGVLKAGTLNGAWASWRRLARTQQARTLSGAARSVAPAGRLAPTRSWVGSARNTRLQATVKRVRGW